MTAASGARILVVDDEPVIRKVIRTNLSRHGYHVAEAEAGHEALALLASFKPDVIVLDLSLPDIDGLEVIERVRKLTATPIIVLSARGSERDKVSALDLGADDYLTKPFGINELLARIRVALRHISSPSNTSVFRTGDLEVDFERRQVRIAGHVVDLTPTEYELLKAFAAQPDRVLTHSMLESAVWGPAHAREPHYLHVYVARLRKKLEANSQQPHYLKTEPGVGYRLVLQDSL